MLLVLLIKELDYLNKMGRKKNEDRPIELQTSPINLRVSNEARNVLNNVPKYNRGKWMSERITKKLYTREELNAYASEKVKEALKFVGEDIHEWYARSSMESTGLRVKTKILSLETELIELINKEK